MPSPLSVDLRERVVAAVAAGASCRRVAARFGVSVSSASRWSERFRHEGQLASKPMGGDHTSKRSQIGDKPFRFDLTHPEPTGGGTIYRLGDETLAFKPLNETLYLAQLNSSGLYRYGYVLRNNDGVEVLALRQEVHSDATVRSSAANILFKPAQNGWQEMMGTRSDLSAFLTGAKLGMMHSVGQCTFRKAISPDTPLTKGLRLSTTREQALKLPGAEPCDLGDVCLPLSPATLERVPAAERAGVRIQVAFDPDQVRSVTLTAKGLSPTSTLAVLGDVGQGTSRAGPYTLPLVMALNDARPDILRAKREFGGDPQKAAALLRPIERLKDLPGLLVDPSFRSAELVVLPAEIFVSVRDLSSAEQAAAKVRGDGGPYVRTILRQVGTGKLDASVEIVP